MQLGFIGADCGTEKDAIPTITYAPKDGVCDIRIRPCRKVFIYAKNITATDILSCRVAHVQVNVTYVQKSPPISDKNQIIMESRSCRKAQFNIHAI